jgi:very-short-patch-repair endonuclease
MAADSKHVFAIAWRAFGNGSELYPEYRWHPKRRWKADYALPFHRILIEIEGGAWSDKRQRHTWGTGFEKDCEKYNEAAILGWRVLRFTPQMMRREPKRWIEQVLRALEDAIG